MDAKRNQLITSIVVILFIVGISIYLIYDQLQLRKGSKVQSVSSPPQQQVSNNRSRIEQTPHAPEPLPALNLLKLDGTPFKLSDYSGKFVLLQIWSTNDPLSLQELGNLKPIYDKYLLDSRMVIVSVCAEADAATIGRIAEGSHVGWLGAMAAPDAPAATKDFVANPGLLILGKDGNIIERPQDAWDAFAVLMELLPKQRSPQPSAVAIDFEQIPNQPTDSPQALPFKRIPPPAADDSATAAKIQIVDGRLHGQSGAPKILVDGKLPPSIDAPSENLFFIAKSIEGRFLMDLTRPIDIKQINSYTWHGHARSPQVFRLYAANGQEPTLNPAPKFGIDPARAGWTLIADVNTNPAPWPRGITGISLHAKDPAKTIGSYRYLLFLAFPTETKDPQGHTFFSEIDVIEAK